MALIRQLAGSLADWKGLEKKRTWLSFQVRGTNPSCKLAVYRLDSASSAMSERAFSTLLATLYGPGAVFRHCGNLNFRSSMVMSCSSWWSWLPVCLSESGRKILPSLFVPHTYKKCNIVRPTNKQLMTPTFDQFHKNFQLLTLSDLTVLQFL